MTVYAHPGTDGSDIEVKSRYGHYIGGEWVDPVKGDYFENISPVNGKPFTEVGRGTAEDIEAALDAAARRRHAWGRTSTTERSNILLKIADRMEAEPRGPRRRSRPGTTARPSARRWPPTCRWPSTTSATSPAPCAPRRARIGEIDENTVAYHFHEPLGVVGQIIPWNFPILMAVWKLAPALAAGNAVVLKPAEQTPWSILKLMELIGDLLPAGVLNVVNGFGVEAGKPLASSSRGSRKIAFTGETTTGRLIMQYASAEHHPGHPRARRQEPEHLLRRRRRRAGRLLRQGARGLHDVRAQPGRGLHLPVAGAGAAVDLLRLRARRDRAGRGDHAGQPARRHHDDRRPGLQRPAREDPVLPRHRQAGGREGAHRR